MWDSSVIGAIFIDIGEFYKGKFVDEKGSFVDVDEFYKEGKLKIPDANKMSIYQYLSPLSDWLQEHYPELEIDLEFS